MNWKILRITPSQNLLDALSVIDNGVCQLALITDEDDHLLGVVSDGDIRRALLQGKDLRTTVAEVMNTAPMTVTLEEGRGVALLRLRQNDLRRIPVLDAHRRVCDLWALEELMHCQALPYPVVIMAGGLGSRLAPLTEDMPKPMLSVGGQPLLEIILQTLAAQGFRQYHICVNYLAQQIVDYFKDGSRLGVSINYVYEEQRLGTAGALALLPPFALPCVVMNGDILTRLNFVALMESHVNRQSVATMVVKQHSVEIPYGVVQCDETGTMAALEEKPRYNFPISAGINVLSPEALALVPRDTFFDMPDLFHTLLQQGQRPGVYEMDEYWLDIGRIGDYRRANEEWQMLFRSGRA